MLIANGRDIRMEEPGFLDSSIGVLLTDRGKFLKGGDRLYSELLKASFMVRLPGGEKARYWCDGAIAHEEVNIHP